MDLKNHFSKIIYLSTFLENFKGLMLKKEISSSECYILETNGIHTFFMKFPIDVVYLDEDKRVIKKYKKMNPSRMGPVYFKCKYVLEFTNEKVIDQIKIGDTIEC